MPVLRPGLLGGARVLPLCGGLRRERPLLPAAEAPFLLPSLTSALPSCPGESTLTACGEGALRLSVAPEHCRGLVLQPREQRFVLSLRVTPRRINKARCPAETLQGTACFVSRILAWKV